MKKHMMKTLLFMLLNSTSIKFIQPITTTVSIEPVVLQTCCTLRNIRIWWKMLGRTNIDTSNGNHE